MTLLFIAFALAQPGSSPPAAPGTPTPTTVAPAPEPSAAPAVRGAFKAGESRWVEIRGVHTRKSGAEAREEPMETDALIRVLEAGDAGWTLEITLKAPRRSKLTPELREIVAKQIEAFATPIRARLEPSGVMTVQNLDELKAAALRAGRRALEDRDKALGRETSPETLAKTLAIVEKMFEDKRATNDLMLKHYAPLFAHLGTTVAPGASKTADVQIPSPATSGALDARMTSTLKAKEGRLELTTETVPEEASVKRALAGFVDRFRAMLPKDAPPLTEAEIATWTLAVKTRTEVEFDPATGWPLTLRSVREWKLKLAREDAEDAELAEYTLSPEAPPETR